MNTTKNQNYKGEENVPLLCFSPMPDLAVIPICNLRMSYKTKHFAKCQY